MSAPVKLSTLKSTYVSMVVYGGPGVGKTTFACGSTKYNIFLFDIDDGTASLRTNPAIKQDNIYVKPCKTFTDFLDGLRYLQANIQHFQVVVIDTATELQRIILAEIKEKKKGDGRQQWGETLDMMEALTRTFKGLNAHRIFTAHEIEDRNNENQATVYKAAFQGQYGQNNIYSKHFDIVMRQFVVDITSKDEAGQNVTTTHRYLNCQRDERTYCKDRLNVLQKYEHPEFDGIFDRIEAALKGS